MPAPQGIHSCKNGLTCGRKNGSPGTAHRTLCRTGCAKSSTARCRYARRRTCQWKKERGRIARATWESRRGTCAEKRWLQAHERLVMTIWVRLFQPVIWSFTRNDYVMHMALTQPCAADSDEPRLLLQFRDGLGSAIAHAGAHAAHKLIHHFRQGSTIRHASFNSFRHKFIHAIAAAVLIPQSHVLRRRVFSALRVALA